MPTNDERREVAARLRRYLSYAIKHDADEHVEPCIHDNAMFRNIAQAVGGGISNITDTYEETLVKLIDLIEPEHERTCEGHRCEETGEWVCHKCGGSLAGCMFDPVRDGFVCVPNYCPSCRAKVVEE